jgi:molecular chaperone HtpG
LSRLAESDPKKLQHIIKLHYLAMKALALEDDDFFRVIIDFLPFETTFGRVTLNEYKKHNARLKYISGLDQYRQAAQVAAAQSMWLINGGYVYDSELLLKHNQLFPLIPVEAVDGLSLIQDLSDISADESDKRIQEFLSVAGQALERFNCSATIKKFLPNELSVLYVVDEQYSFIRSVEHSKSISDAVWGGVLDNLAHQIDPAEAQVCFNFNNHLIQKLMSANDAQLLTMSIQMLYVQVLLLGHHPLDAEEMKVLNMGFVEIIEWGLQNKRLESEWMAHNLKTLH